MDTPSLALVSTLFLLIAVGLLIWHVRAWRAYQREDLDVEELDYRRRQYRRRMQTSAILGGLAVAMFLGTLLTFQLQSRTFTVVFWGVFLLVLAFVAVLAAADMVATRRHFHRARSDCLVQRAVLQAELRRIQAARGNGKLEKIPGANGDGPESQN
jgi:UDP-N-acetylmuramyl pentapeptide phosphotransferase/UDP-N-acetylglucosamine-1-phosphate transferase